VLTALSDGKERWGSRKSSDQKLSQKGPFLIQFVHPHDTVAEAPLGILDTEKRILKQLLGVRLCSMRECIVEHIPDVIVGESVVDVPSLTAM